MDNDFIDENKELGIRKKKEKRLKKHYSAFVGDVEVKLINYLIKKLTRKFENGELLILKSNIPFPDVDRGEVIIKIKHEDIDLTVKGKFRHGASGQGTHELAFTIIDK